MQGIQQILTTISVHPKHSVRCNGFMLVDLLQIQVNFCPEDGVIVWLDCSLVFSQFGLCEDFRQSYCPHFWAEFFDSISNLELCNGCALLHECNDSRACGELYIQCSIVTTGYYAELWLHSDWQITFWQIITLLLMTTCRPYIKLWSYQISRRTGKKHMSWSLLSQVVLPKFGSVRFLALFQEPKPEPAGTAQNWTLGSVLV